MKRVTQLSFAVRFAGCRREKGEGSSGVVVERVRHRASLLGVIFPDGVPVSSPESLGTQSSHSRLLQYELTMVRVHQQRRRRLKVFKRGLPWACLFFLIVICLRLVTNIPGARNLEHHVETEQLTLVRQQSVGENEQPENTEPAVCPYMQLTDLAASERYPKASADRHTVNPPLETNTLGVALVCCDTTKGPLSIMVHHSWAPNGARRFLDMVENNYFGRVPLMRCVDKFLCQFGLNGNPTAMKPFRHTIPDDPNWLPSGKEFRKNKLGIKRFNKGYLAYAGSGPNSRNLQWIVALEDNGPLGGGSPWEVPWGELVGDHSYKTLSTIYTGYGESGPKQGILHKSNSLETYVKVRFPKLDYIKSCRVVDSDKGQQEPGSTMTK